MISSPILRGPLRWAFFSSEEAESHDEQDVYDHKPVGHGFLLILLVLLPNSFGQSGNGQAGRNDNQQNGYKP